MSQPFKIDRELTRRQLAALQSYIDERHRTVDEVQEWVCARVPGIKLSRGATWSWMNRRAASVPPRPEKPLSFGEKLAALTHDGSRRSLAKDLKLPAGAIQDHIRKGFTPTGNRALAIARALGVPVEWLLDDECGMPAPTALDVAIQAVRALSAAQPKKGKK